MARPKPEYQLDDSAQKGTDCGTSSTSMAADRMSQGLIHPTTERVRKLADVPEGPTNPWDWRKALLGLAPNFKARGLKPPRLRLVDGGQLTQLRKQLLDGVGAIGAINYGVVANRKPRLWSSTSFRGNHAIYMHRARLTPDGRVEVLVYDPLADGRTVGGKKMVKGPKWWPWSLVAAALERVLNKRGKRIYPDGKWLGLLVWTSAKIKKPKPGQPEPPPEPETPEEPEPDEPGDPDDETPQSELEDAISDLEELMEQQQAVVDRMRALLGPDSISTDEPMTGVVLDLEGNE